MKDVQTHSVLEFARQSLGLLLSHVAFNGQCDAGFVHSIGGNADCLGETSHVGGVVVYFNNAALSRHNGLFGPRWRGAAAGCANIGKNEDRKSTRLNSS